MSAVEVNGLTHRYGRRTALDEVAFEVPEGSVYALIGPNGAGKTTLLQILIGALRATAGSVRILGRPVGDLRTEDRGSIAYVAEGLRLPSWMTIGELQAYVAPLHATWDAGLAADLMRRFRLESRRRIGTLSKGEHMKTALLCALSSRPRLLLMDEPFTGMDALVKDELVRGVLELASTKGWSVLVSSHDLGELEMLADHVGFLDDGCMVLSESLETVRERYRRVEVVLEADTPYGASDLPDGWLDVDRSGRRVAFLVMDPGQATRPFIERFLPGVARIEQRAPTLREVFVALARRAREPEEVAG